MGNLCEKEKSRAGHEKEEVVHPFPPVFDSECRILILGSMPSSESRKQNFYYGHPRNRFWKVLAFLLNEPLPQTAEQKTSMLLRNHIALWDVLESCSIQGSSDSSIADAVPADLTRLMSQSKIEHIFCNGKTAFRFYGKFQSQKTHIQAVGLPSTSPANAAWNLERLEEAWKKEILPVLKSAGRMQSE